MQANSKLGGVWIFGDYRNYFQNRVTLQLISKGRELAEALGTETGVVVLGEKVHQYAMEYVAHGADLVIVGDHPDLREYQVERYTALLAGWVESYKPEILLAGATSFGREFFPRLAKRLGTGLSADCIALRVDPETGLLVQTAPSFRGDLIADVVTPDRRPQMATVHPGAFEERPHDPSATGRIVYPRLGALPEERIKILRSRRLESRKIHLEDAQVVVVGGRGLGSRERFSTLFELAELLEGEVGATRPAIRAGWAEEERLIGQTGKSVRPRLLITVGTSGALQYTAGVQGAEVIIAVNRDPHAPIFKIADLGLVGDAKTLMPLLLEALRRRI